MSSSTPIPAKGKGAKAAKPFWKMELGRKGGADADEEIEHAPFVATLPRVNLLPQDVRNAIGLRKARRAVIWVGAVMVAAIGAVWFLQSGTITDAEANVARATQEGTALQAKVDALAAITDFTRQLESQREIVTATLAEQPLAAQVMRQLAQAGTAASDGGTPVTFANIGVSYEGIPPAGGPFNPCPNPDPFGTELTIGCVSFSATAGGPNQVSRVLEVLEADPMFVGPYVTNTQLADTAGPGGDSGSPDILFNGTAGISLDGLRTPLTPEQVDAIVNPPAPADDATADEAETDGGS